MDVFLARIVIPLSRSSSLESKTRSSTCWLSLKMRACFSIASTKVVLPWSTCAMMATFLISFRSVNILPHLQIKNPANRVLFFTILSRLNEAVVVQPVFQQCGLNPSIYQ